MLIHGVETAAERHIEEVVESRFGETSVYAYVPEV